MNRFSSFAAAVILLAASAHSSSAAEATYHSFSTSNTVSRINGDGGLNYSFPLPNFGSFTQPSGMAIDPKAKKLYYCRVNFIGSVNLDGTGNEVVKDFGISPLHLELDVENGHLYFYLRGSNSTLARGTYRMNIDGTDMIPIITAATLAAMDPPPDPLVSPNGEDGIVIATNGAGSLYWSDDRRLYRSTLAGLHPEVLATFPFNISSFEIDTANSVLYYANSVTLNRSDLDGSDQSVVYGPGFGFPEALELDPESERLYFIHNSKLKYTNLDGSLEPVEVIGVSTARGKDIEVGPMPALTEPKITGVDSLLVANRRTLKVTHTTDPGIRYTFEWSPDLSAGSWTAFEASVIGTGAEMSTNFSIDVKRRFFRVLRDDPCE